MLLRFPHFCTPSPILPLASIKDSGVLTDTYNIFLMNILFHSWAFWGSRQHAKALAVLNYNIMQVFLDTDSPQHLNTLCIKYPAKPFPSAWTMPWLKVAFWYFSSVSFCLRFGALIPHIKLQNTIKRAFIITKSHFSCSSHSVQSFTYRRARHD